MTYILKIRFYLKGSGRNPIEEFIEGCSADIQYDFVAAMNLLTEGKGSLDAA